MKTYKFKQLRALPTNVKRRIFFRYCKFVKEVDPESRLSTIIHTLDEFLDDCIDSTMISSFKENEHNPYEQTIFEIIEEELELYALEIA